MPRAAALALLLASSALASSDDVHWSQEFAPPPEGEGLNAQVLALADWNGTLVASGDFTDAGGLPVGYVAAWDGGAWSDLGGGTDGTVVVVQAWGDSLVVGGFFSAAGGVPATNIALYDGVSWSALGSGVNDVVRALAVYEGELYAGGEFTEAGGVLVSHIARWDGASWHPLGDGTSSRVVALTVYNGQLIAGGLFDEVGGVTVNHVAAWGGKAWSPLGTGTDSRVRSLGVFDGKLIAGGGFSSAGGVSAERIAAWDGATWSSIGTGFDDEVRGLSVYNDRLIAVGEFVIPAGAARWSGAEWQDLGSGVNGPAWATVVTGGDLFLGGAFGATPDGSTSFVARWGNAQDDTLHVPAEHLLVQSAVDSVVALWGVPPGEPKTVQIAPGEFLEDIVVGGPTALEVRGSGTRQTTIGSFQSSPTMDGGMSNLTALGTIEVYGGDRLHCSYVRAERLLLTAYENVAAYRCTTDVAIDLQVDSKYGYAGITECVSESIRIFASVAGGSVRRSVANYISIDGDEHLVSVEECTATSGIRATSLWASVSDCTVLDGDIYVDGTCWIHFNGDASAGGNNVPNGSVFVTSTSRASATGNVAREVVSVSATDVRAIGNSSESIDVAFHLSTYCDGDVNPFVEVRNNVVRSGGLHVAGAGLAPGLICSGNTVVGAEVGIQFEEWPTDSLSMARNVVADVVDGVFFPSTSPPPLLRLRCNNVWDVAEAVWAGIPDPTGIDGNTSVDPLFCDPAAGDYTLAANSPCLPGQHPDGYDCGLIGALGEGCEAARPDLLPELFLCLPDTAAAWHDEADSLLVGAVVTNAGNVPAGPFDVRIEVDGCVGFWGDTRSLAGLAPGAQDTVYAGPFAVLPDQCVASVWVDPADDVEETDEENNTLVDQSVCVVLGSDGPGTVHLVPRVFPVPTRGALTISTGLATPTTVEVFDGAGRLVRRLEATGSVIWDGRSRSGARVADGIYFVRVAESGFTERVVMVR